MRQAIERCTRSPRCYTYVAVTILVVITSYLLGKEMIWDTMDYHVYAGFSALHDRFRRDYFAAGPQGYFNPYGYIPFYLLIRSSLSPLADASILAVLQSGILWLTFELGLVSAPTAEPRTRVAFGVLAALLAFVNPVLINQFGSSSIDVTTAEVVLAGWLLLVFAVRQPSAIKVAAGGLLLGVASALKPTNAVHAVAAAAILPFIPVNWWGKVRAAATFAATMAGGFLLVNLPWSIHLERHFGNPLFPLLNGIFRSPYYSTASMLDYRFIPDGIAAALARPFAIMRPAPMVQYELVAPDLRYGLLLLLAVAVLVRGVWRKMRHAAVQSPAPEHVLADRAVAALGAGFLMDWVMWLVASGNGRYFIPMACVAAILCLALLFRLLGHWPRARNYGLAIVVLAQTIQVSIGSGYRVYQPWRNRPWFSVKVPAKLAEQRNLYLMLGGETNSFIIPDMPRGSAFVNLGGSYMLLRPDGPNGRRVAALIHRYGAHVKVVVQDILSDAAWATRLPNSDAVDNDLSPFGLRVVPNECEKIVVRGVMISYRVVLGTHEGHRRPRPSGDTEYLMVCNVVRAPAVRAVQLPGGRTADLAFDHLEEACPQLFAPRRPGNRIMGDRRSGYFFERVYLATGMVVWITRGKVYFERLINGHEETAGAERLWQSAVPRVACGRARGGFLRILEPGA